MVLNRRYLPLRYLAIASITAALIMLPSVTSAHAPPSVFLLDATNLMAAQTAVRNGDPTIQAAVAALRKQADKALVEGPFTVTRKMQSPPSGDLHDYVSLSIYWWPDPASDSGLPYIQKDGVRNPESDDTSRYDANPLTHMVGDVETLSLAYFLTGDQRYASHGDGLAAGLVSYSQHAHEPEFPLRPDHPRSRRCAGYRHYREPPLHAHRG